MNPSNLPVVAAATPWSLRGLFKDAHAGLVLAVQQIFPLWRLLMVLSLVVAAAIGALFLLSAVTDTPMALLTRDVAATAGVKFYIGILSSVGALTWCASACVCWFAAAALRGVAHLREPARFLAGAGALQTLLGADDFFMLHEAVYPKLGLHEELIVSLYGLALLALLLRFRRQLLDSELLLFLIGGALFGGSVLVDLAVRDATALEDILKVAGVAVWLTYFWRYALACLREVRAAAVR
jgi:hypothetical protein